MSAGQAGAADPYGQAIADMLAWTPAPFFVQVGGFDGVSFDPLRPHIVAKNLSGLIVEPIPLYFEKIRQLYAGSDRVVPVNCAIAETDGERAIWRFLPEAVARGVLPPHFAGISSFLMEDLLKDSGVLGHSCPDEQTRTILRSLVEPVTVACRRFESLFAEHGVGRVDILQIDTEGYDYRILKLFDFERFRPAIVHYEHQHLGPADREAAEALLRSHGYRLSAQTYDTLAVFDRGQAQAVGLRRLAGTLHAEGRSEDAQMLLEHLATLHPGDAATLRLLVTVLGAQGRTLEAIGRLIVLKGLESDRAALLAAMQEQFQAAVAHFNRHLDAGELETAESYAAALADLAPNAAPFVAAALDCNQALGRLPKAVHYARRMLAIDPSHRGAHRVLADHGRAAGDKAGEMEHRLALALAPDPAGHPLLSLADIHGAAGWLLCRPLDEGTLDRLRALYRSADSLTIGTGSDPRWEGWERHFRLQLEATDPAQLQAPLPADLAPAPAFAEATGAPLGEAGLRAVAAAQGAEVVFFVAADEAYVQRYARLFVRSVLRHTDVPCLVLVHVVGGGDRLAAIAREVGLDDPRLVYSGDRFDAAAVATRCIAEPPAGLMKLPVAHYQSARFQLAGTLLEILGLPLLVSDIDCLLQRGVRDLLDRVAGADLVLNEHGESTLAATRLTANLLLLNPTANTAAFLRFLRGYLDRALGRPEVTRWIDQAGLLMARHHLWMTVPEARIAYFDTLSDINNVMYASYEPHPFRFLSLYSGFDLTSLEAEPAAPG